MQQQIQHRLAPRASELGGSYEGASLGLGSSGKFPTNELGIFSYIEVQGPFARFVEDLIYVLPILAGPDGHDPYACPVAVRDLAQVDLKTLRVAFYAGNGITEPRADIGEMIKQVAVAIAPLVASINEAVPEIDRETYTKFGE